MKYFIREQGMRDRKFDNIQDFLDVISNIAETYEENNEDCFVISIENAQGGKRCTEGMF